MLRETFKLDDFSSLPLKYKEAKDIFSQIRLSYESYFRDYVISSSINFILGRFSKVLQSLEHPLISEPKVKKGILDLALHLLITGRAFGLIYWSEVPLIYPIPSDKILELSSYSKPLYALRLSIDELMLLKKLKGKNLGSGLEHFFEREVRDEDLLLTLDKDYISLIRADVKRSFILKEDSFFSYTLPRISRVDPPPIFKVQELIFLRNQILTSHKAYYLATSFYVYLLTAGSKEESVETITQKIKSYVQALKEVDRVGVLGGDYTVDLKAVSQEGRGEINRELEEVKYLNDELRRSIIQILDDVNFGLEGITTYLEDLVNKFISLVNEKKKENFEFISLDPLIVSKEALLQLIRLRDRADITRTTLLNSLGISISREKRRRLKEKKEKLDDVLTPPFIPFQGKGRPSGSS